MTIVLINIVLVFIAVVFARDLGRPIWSAIKAGQMPGFVRPYTRKDTPFRFYFVVVGSFGLIAASAGLASFFLFFSVRDFLRGLL